MIKNFENKFNELRVEGCRKDAVSTSVMYTEDMEMEVDLSEDHYTESEMKEMEVIFMRTESEAQKSFQRNSPYRRQSLQRQRSSSRDSRFNNFQKQSQSRYDRHRLMRDDRGHDQSRSQDNRERPLQTFSRCIGCHCGNCN